MYNYNEVTYINNENSAYSKKGYLIKKQQHVTNILEKLSMCYINVKYVFMIRNYDIFYVRIVFCFNLWRNFSSYSIPENNYKQKNSHVTMFTKNYDVNINYLKESLGIWPSFNKTCNNNYLAIFNHIYDQSKYETYKRKG